MPSLNQKLKNSQGTQEVFKEVPRSSPSTSYKQSTGMGAGTKTFLGLGAIGAIGGGVVLLLQEEQKEEDSYTPTVPTLDLNGRWSFTLVIQSSTCNNWGLGETKYWSGQISHYGSSMTVSPSYWVSVSGNIDSNGNFSLSGTCTWFTSRGREYWEGHATNNRIEATHTEYDIYEYPCSATAHITGVR